MISDPSNSVLHLKGPTSQKQFRSRNLRHWGIGILRSEIHSRQKYFGADYTWKIEKRGADLDGSCFNATIFINRVAAWLSINKMTSLYHLLLVLTDILYDSWSPAMTVSSVCISILSMLSSSTTKVWFKLPKFF